MNRQIKHFFSLTLVLLLAFGHTAYSQQVPSISIEAACTNSQFLRNFVIVNTGTVDADLNVINGISTVQLQLAVGESYTLETSETSITVENAADQSVLATSSQPTADICQPLLTANDTCSSDPNYYSWVFYNTGSTPVDLHYYIDTDPFGNSRIVNVTSDTDSLEILPGDTVIVHTNVSTGDRINITYEGNGAFQQITNDAGACPSTTPDITVTESCSQNPAERVYNITNNSSFDADLQILAGFFPTPLQLAAGQTFVYVTGATQITILNTIDQLVLATASQPNPTICVAPIVVNDTCSSDPSVYSWVFYNFSNDAAPVYYTVDKLTSQRVVNLTNVSDSIDVLPGDTVLINTDINAGEVMCVFYENGLVDTIINDAGACPLPLPDITVTESCSQNAAERVYNITNNSSYDADLQVLAGFFPTPLQLTAGQTFAYVTTATQISVLNTADGAVLATASQPDANICVAPIVVNDTCSSDPSVYSWVFYNHSNEAAPVYYTVDKLTSQRVVNTTATSDSIDVLPGDTVLINTDINAGEVMCVFYENGLVDTIINDAGACPLPLPDITVTESCSQNAAERVYNITNNSSYDADLQVLAGFFPTPLQLTAGQTYEYVTTATQITILNTADGAVLATASQPDANICVAPIVVNDTCSSDPSVYSWVFYNHSNEAAPVYYTVDKLTSQRVVNTTATSDSIDVLPGDTVLINTDINAGEVMCVFYENGLVDTIINDAGACPLPLPDITVTESCSQNATERVYNITNNSSYDADLQVLAGFFPTPLQLTAGQTFAYVTGATQITILNTADGAVLATASQPDANICVAPIVVNDTCSTDPSVYSWVFYNHSNEAAPVYYTVDKLTSQRVVNTTATSDSIDVLPGDTVLINTDINAGEVMCVFYENGLVDTIINDAGYCAPEIEITTACVLDEENRKYIINNLSPYAADVQILAGFFPQAAQIPANGSYTYETTATQITVLYPADQSVLATASQPDADVCQAPIVVTDTCSDNSDKYAWVFYNTGNEIANIYYATTKITSQRVVNIDSNADSVELLPGDTVYVSTDVVVGDAMCVFYENGLVDTIFNDAGSCDPPVTDVEIDVVPVCYNGCNNKHRWKFENTNDFTVDVTLAHNGNVITLPAAGDGVDANGNAGGNFTFLLTPANVEPLVITYGNSQSLSVNYTAGRCDMNPDPESCDGDRFTYTLKNAISDSYHNGNHNHSIWLSGFNGGSAVRMTFDPDAYLVLRDNGSRAYITGNATMTQGPLAGSRWVVYAPFGRKADHTGFKKELKSNAYDPNDGGVDTDLWKIFLMKDNAFMRQLDGDGYIKMTRKPANGNLGLQVGVGANGKNINLGASAWFDYSYNGQAWKQGDFNLDLKAYCPPIQIDVDALCKTQPWKNRWRITNSSDRSFRIKYSIDGGTKYTKFIPKAGKGKDADGNANSGDFTFINTHVNKGNTMTVYYAFDQEVTVEADSMYCPVPDGTIDVINVCTNKRNKNKWRISNSNDFPVYIKFAHNDRMYKLPAAGSGADADGNPNSGNYKFTYTHKSITELSFTYGAGQSASALFVTGPCSVTPDPESCDNGKWTYSLSNAVSDAYHSGNSNHSIALSGLGRLTFEDGAYMVYNSNGRRAYITGTATFHSGSLNGTSWNVYAPFETKNDLTGPKKELRSNAYDPNDGGVDTDSWAYFLMKDNAFMKQVDGDGYIQMSRMPADGRYGLQIGKGANGKNINFGASSWFFYSLNGGDWKQGDFNLDASPECDDINPCSIYYIDNAKDKIYFTEPNQTAGNVNLKTYVNNPYADSHIALNIDGTKLWVFESRGPLHSYGYFDTQTHVFVEVGELNIPGGIVQAAFNPQGQLYFSSTSSNEIFVMDDPMSPGTEVSYGTITIQETGQTMNIAGADIAFDQDGSFYIGTHAHGAAIFTVSGMQNHLVAKQFGHACRGKITGMAVMSDSRTLIYSVKNATGMYVVDMDNPNNFQFLNFQGPVSRSGWGDMTSACLDYVESCEGYAVSVVNFNQGTQQDGGAVPDQRSDATKALGAPQENDTYNFVSLGFRGTIELELESPVYNHNKNGVLVGNENSIEDAYGDGYSYADFIIVETSFGRMNTNCGPDQTGNYPELALVYGKEKLEDDWVLLTPNTVCRTSFIDIGPAVESGQLEYVKYVKILDCTDYARFGGNADGYDVDGLIICPDEVIGAITGEGRGALVNARTDGESDEFTLNLDFVNTVPNDAEDNFAAAEVVFNVFPNPSSGMVTVASNLGLASEADLVIYSTSGSEVFRSKVSGETKTVVDLSKFGRGVYIVRMSNEAETRTTRVVIH